MYIYFIELLVYGQGAGLIIPEKIERIPKRMDLDPKRKRKRSLNNLGFVGNGSRESEKAASRFGNNGPSRRYC